METKDAKAKGGFWGGLLRRGSAADKAKPRPARRERQGESRPHRERPSEAPDAQGGRKRKPSRNDHSTRDERVPSPQTPVAQWPRSGMSSQEELSRETAKDLIARGAPSHKGFRRPVPHVSEQFYSLYAASSGNRNSETDRANLHDTMVQLMTFRMQGPGEASAPWGTLEQPSCAFMYGRQPGTVTLNHWACMASQVPEALALRDSGVVPRPMTLRQVFERLKEIQASRQEGDEGALYKTLYKRILRDPDRILSPRKSLEKQITDLILALSRTDWIDFTDQKNQVVTRFIFDPIPEDYDAYTKFFHQLLLSVELDVRIQCRQHSDWAKDALLQQIPPTIRWNLGLARRWRDYIRVEEYGDTPNEVKFRFKLQKRQIKMLKKFASTMKWPNLNHTLEAIKSLEEERASDAPSSDAFAFLSGLVLPGPTFPFLIMNTLIDIDPDEATDDLALLSHMHPSCGFQYRNSHTYWSTAGIVGKVMAPTCQALAGWAGPCRPTQDLGRSQIARIRTRRPRQRLRVEDVESMAERSDPLGPPAQVYPVEEYVLATPNVHQVCDAARVELLALREVQGDVIPAGPKLFDATVQVAVDGVSWPLRLSYDVSFISAWPCTDGPHPLFFDYIYKTVPPDELVNINDWGGLYSKSSKSARSTPAPFLNKSAQQHEHQEEEVLVVEAFGVADNQVLARAWCSHWGLGAIVADIEQTCMACAIRECYAAALTVLILVEKTDDDDEEEQ